MVALTKSVWPSNVQVWREEVAAADDVNPCAAAQDIGREPDALQLGYTRMFQVMAVVALLVTVVFYLVSASCRPSRPADEQGQ